jgi:hypothetical protein
LLPASTNERSKRVAVHHSEVTAEQELAHLVACTLSHTDLKSQRERWINVGTNFGLGRVETDHGVELNYKDHPAVERELRALVAVENDCCGWAAWSVKREKGVLVMEARSKGEGIATLHGMFREAMPS